MERMRSIVDEEIRKLQQAPPEAREFERALNQIESSFYNRMERIGSFGGVGDQLNAYYVEAGNPGYFNEDLSRYRALSPPDVQAADIKARFKLLVKRHHPDANGGDRTCEDKLREIIQAYNYLKSAGLC